MTQTAPFEGRAKTLADLMATAEMAPQFIIEDILTPGLLLLVASPKAGKTRLMLQLSDAVSHGEPALGRFPTRQAGVLYYSLEDRGYRIGRAAKSMNLRPSEDLYVLDSLPVLDSRGCDQLRKDLDERPNAGLVVIDVLNRVMPKSDGGRSAYHDEAAALTPLQQLAAERNIAVVVVHHTNKNPDPKQPLLAINGTQALGGTADNIWLLSREGNDGRGHLHVLGRDVKEQIVPLRFSAEGGKWMADSPHQAGPFVPLLKSSRERVREAILDGVPETGISRQKLLKALSEQLGASIGRTYLESAMDDCLRELVHEGQVEKWKPGRESYYRLAKAA